MRRLLRSPQSRLPSSPIRGTAARGIAVAGLAVLLAMGPAAAQSGEPHPQEQQKAAPANPSEPPKEAPRKVDEYAEAAQAINGPAGNPECVWLGQRIVNMISTPRSVTSTCTIASAAQGGMSRRRSAA